jgi:hypothetical protein
MMGCELPLWPVRALRDDFELVFSSLHVIVDLPTIATR